VLASGTGTILAAILGAGLPVSVVILDRECPASQLAGSADVEVEVVHRESYGADFDRAAYTHRIVEALKRHQIDVIAMAGFGTVLAPPIFDVYSGRILNTHPSLLPAFKGWHAVPDALEMGVKVTGTTVHIATEEVDAGPILAQEPVRVEPGDTEETLHERIKVVERRLYPETIRLFMEQLQGGATS
jgi:phosphoribosylglycinamide formyltransferase 1